MPSFPREGSEVPVPLYDYRCEKGHRYEKREPFGSPAVQPCEKCGETARRVLHAPAIAFRGSGWYQNDSRGSRRSTSEEKSSPSDSSDKSEQSDGKSGGATDRKQSGKTGGATDRKQSGKTEKAAAD